MASVIYADLLSQAAWKWIIIASVSLFLFAICVFAARVVRDQLTKWSENSPIEPISISPTGFSISEKKELDKMENDQSALIEALYERVEILESEAAELRQSTQKDFDFVSEELEATFISLLFKILDPQEPEDINTDLEELREFKEFVKSTFKNFNEPIKD
jgi:hypothetical protein